MPQKNWDKYEVALLIETYQNIKQGKVDRNSALVTLSQNLRKMAQNEGLEIDDTFRNLNGMQWQIGNIEKLFNGTSYETRAHAHIFVEMVGIYDEAQEEYQKILEEAHQKILDRTNLTESERKGLFIKWLSKNSDSFAEIVIFNLTYVSTYAIKRNIAQKSFWSISDYREFDALRTVLLDNKLFKLMRAREYRQFQKNGELYSNFLKLNFPLPTQGDEGKLLSGDSTVSSAMIGETADNKTVVPLTMQACSKENDGGVSNGELCSDKEKQVIARFFDGNTNMTNLFITLYKYQKRACPSTVLDVRATIMGARRDGERLRFYVDKQRRISFSKLKVNEKKYVKPFTDSSLSDFYLAVDETNKYFNEHPEEVKLYRFIETVNKRDLVNALCEECRKILNADFSSGFKLGNVLARKRFYNRYEKAFGKPFILDANEFETLLHNIGFNYENVIYSANILSEDSKNRIISYIIRALRDDTQVIYYSALYEHFKEILLGYVFNSSMLKAYLKFINCSDFYCGEIYLSLYKDVQVDLKKELIRLFVNLGRPLTYDELYAKLPNIEKEQINATLRDKDFIVNQKGKSYFYKEIFVYTEEQIAQIKEFLYNRVVEVGASSGAELYAFISDKLPEMREANPEITDLGFRGVLRLHLENNFDFKGDIISYNGQNCDVASLYRRFCLDRESFSIDELNEFKAKTNPNIYFDVIFDNSIRINQSQYIRRDKIHFDIDKIDMALESFFDDDYLPFENVIYYTEFPTMDYPWNEYMLESYVYSFSKKFTLLHKSFNQSHPTGAIVRRESPIKTWEDLLIKVLRDNKINDEIMTVNDAFNFLKEHKYITVRRSKDIELVIAKAKRN